MEKKIKMYKKINGVNKTGRIAVALKDNIYRFYEFLVETINQIGSICNHK